ncbi:hypothetical protein [Photobacterium indicum]|uniref:hypothetical protein n=1 Tax=Photobacterium indicum TaxID=81447 RepID=UPI003D0A39C9
MKHFDNNSLLVIVITFILFTLALFTTGFTHALFLEAGVFLVSVKLIMMAYHSSVRAEHMEKELKEIKTLLEKAQKDNVD